MKAGELTRRDFLVGAGVGVGASLLPGCAPWWKAPPHVVCINVDQLRKNVADRDLKATGQLAADGGVVFEQMRSTAPWTYPSVLSFMSGLLPQQHGADGHMFDDHLSRFDPALPTLQKLLRTAGYHTAGFVTNPFLHTWNAFNSGFDHFDVSFVGSQGNLRGFPKLVWKPEKMFANSVNAAIREHFDARPLSGPEFSYVHYIDVHGPWKGAPFAPGYGSAVRFVDERIMELYRYFERRYDGELLFFVTSDHGRALANDRMLGYGRKWRHSKASMHEFNLRIPFLVMPSRLVVGPRVVTESCSNIDFVPTLLAWLGIAETVELPGADLGPVIRGESVSRSADRVIYAKMSAFGNSSDCIIEAGLKHIRFFDPKTGDVVARRVFDVRSDPDEVHGLAVDPAIADPIFERMAGTQGVQFEAEFAEADPDVLDRLQALGYFQ